MAPNSAESLLDRRAWLRDVPFWIAATAAGLLAVGFASLCKRAEGFAFHLFERHPYAMLAFTPAVFVAAWAAVHYLAPEAKGSGIPQVMAAVELESDGRRSPLAERMLSARTILVKMASAVLMLLGGGAIGREGPTIQIAAGVFHMIGNRAAKLERRWSLRPEVWMVTGSAAGIAAAFNTPLGGLVFAIEELTSVHFASFRTSLITAVIISGIAAQWISGTYLYLGYPRIPMIGARALAWALVVGAVAGSAGAWFGRALYAVSRLRSRFRSAKSLAVVAAGAGLAAVALAIWVDFRGLGAGRETIVELLFRKAPGSANEPASIGAGIGLAVSRFVSPVLAYVSGAAGGIFAPSLAAGGALGSLLAELLKPDLANLFVILGMIGFLSGVTHAPFTAFVLVLEMTDRHAAILPMMAAALVASGVAKRWHPHSFYERVKADYVAAVETTR